MTALRLAMVALALVLLLWAGAATSLAENRTALVIGNGAYAAAPLANAANDASDMAAALGAVGFEVILRTDADQRAMDEALDEFALRLSERQGVGVFYYSGHGVEVEGQNYLLPVGGAISHERDVKYGALNAGWAIEAMDASGAALSIVVLDACRNNPLASAGRSASRGLSRVSTGGAGLFVSFSTAPGEVALDGDGRNSPYTKYLLEALAVPGLSLEQVFKTAIKGVYSETEGAQVPWISSSFYGDFVFNAEGGGGSQALPADVPDTKTALVLAPAVRSAPASVLDGVYAVEGSNPNGSRYGGMARITGDSGTGGFALDWWIGTQRFSGSGQRDGRWLRVDWGSNSPVIYTLTGEGTLDGVWADGSATELLIPAALAAPQPAGDISGSYDVVGTDLNGGSYRGTATITRAGAGWRMVWSIGSSQYEGEGRLEGRVFTVDWGQASPAVYAIDADGAMQGLWAAGRGAEALTPRR